MRREMVNTTALFYTGTVLNLTIAILLATLLNIYFGSHFQMENTINVNIESIQIYLFAEFKRLAFTRLTKFIWRLIAFTALYPYTHACGMAVVYGWCTSQPQQQHNKTKLLWFYYVCITAFALQIDWNDYTTVCCMRCGDHLWMRLLH